MSGAPGSRRARWAVLALRVALVLVAGRLLLAAIVPFAAERVGRGFGFDVGWSRLRIHYLRAALEIDGLAVAVRAPEGAPANPPWFRAESVRADLAVRDLLGGDLRVQRAALEGAVVVAERRADGSVPVLAAVQAALASDEPKAPPPPKPISFLPPVRVDALRVEQMRLEVRDEVAWSGQTWRFDVDVRGDDLGYPDRRGTLEVRASGPDALDALRVDAQVETRADDVVLDARMHLGALRNAVIAPWLAELAGDPRLQADRAVARIDAAGRLEAHLRVDGSARDGLAGSIALTELSATTDDQMAGHVARIAVEVASLRQLGLRVTSVDVETGSISARRDAEGSLCAFGFALRDGEAPAAGPARAADPSRAFDVAVGAIGARALSAHFRDELYEPAVEIAAMLDQAAVTGIDTRPSGDQPIRLVVEGSLPGIASRLHAKGAAAVFSPRKAVDVAFEASGLRPTAIAPYLAELGLESTLREGTLSARLVGGGRATPTGGVEGELRLSDVKLADERQLFAVRAVEAMGIAIEPAGPSARVRDLTVRGTDVPLERMADGSIAGLGLHTIPVRSSRRAMASTAPAPPVAASSAPPTPAVPLALPRIELDRVAVVENRLTWRDDRLAKPVDVVFDDCGVEVSNLALFGDPARHERTTATVKAWSRARDVVKDIAVSGTITTKPGPLDLALEITGKASGITAVRLQPYIDPTGIQEQLQEAALSGSVSLQVAQVPAGLRASLEMRDLEFRNADASITGAKLVRVEDVLLAPEQLSVESIEVVDASLKVSRDPVGALLALGLRIPLSVFRKAEPDAEPSAAPADASQAQRILDDLPDVRVGSVRVTNAALAFHDQAFTPPLETTARADFQLDRFSTRSPEPARYSVAVAIVDTAEQIRAAGNLRAAPGAALFTAEFSGKGLRAGHLAAYLPAGIECDLRSAELTGRMDVTVSENSAGGLSAALAVQGVRLAESGAQEALLSLDDVEVVVRRADPGAEVFEIERVVSRGLALDATRDAQGRFHALGFVVGAADATPKRDSSAGPDAAASAPPTPSFPDLTLAGSPRIVLDELALDLKRFTFRDDARGTQPVEIEALVATPESQVLVGADASQLPPLRVTVAGAALPFARNVELDLSLAPWAEEPRIAAEFDADGISGAGIDAIAAGLSTWIDGTQLTQGVAHGSVEARLRWRRRSPLDLDFRGGLAADVEVGRLEFRDAPEGRVLLALDGASADIERIDPATGSVHVKTLELRQPEMRAGRTPDGGVALLGLVVHPERRPPPPATDSAPAAEHATEHAPEPAVASAVPPARGEVRVDELVIRGIDVELRDDAATPPTVLPLVDLDVLVQRFTTRAFEEPRVIRFDAWLGAGEAEMPRAEHASNLLSGIAGAVGDVIEGKDEKFALEKRRMFQEAALTGRIQFVPALTGHAQATLSGLELLGFTGTAKHEGVDVGDGTLDASVRLRFRGAEGVRVDTELVFSDLSLAEPKSGPIETYLTLPVPLDTVLFLLENADGEHRIPVGFTLDEEGLTTGKIATAAAGAAASVIGSAIAAAPLRVLSTFTDLFGITGGVEDPPPSAQIAFAPGATELSAEARAALAPLVAKMRADSDFVIQVQHRLGAADVARAEKLANPTPEDCREIAAGLRRRRAELTRERAELAAELRAQWGAGESSVAENTTPRLRAIDAEAGNVEDALDRVLELLKPGAERQRGKRTRAAAMAVARQRIEVLRAWLESQGVPKLDARFEAKSPAFEVGASDAPGSVLAVLRER